MNASLLIALIVGGTAILSWPLGRYMKWAMDPAVPDQDLGGPVAFETAPTQAFADPPIEQTVGKPEQRSRGRRAQVTVGASRAYRTFVNGLFCTCPFAIHAPLWVRLLPMQQGA